MKFVLEETFRGNDFATKKISHQIFLEKTPNLKKKNCYLSIVSHRRNIVSHKEI